MIDHKMAGSLAGLVHVCSEGHPWVQNAAGDWVRESHIDGQKRLLAGAKLARKPYDWKNGF